MISVIIPTYNRASVLGRAIRSVLDQKNAEFEVLVIDDGSTDNTEEIVHAFYKPQGRGHHLAFGANPSSPKTLPLKFISQANRGVSAARNTGIAHAKGEWLAFLDSDDEWMPGMLEAQMSFFEKNPDYKICQTEEIWIRGGVRVNKMKKHEKKGGWIFEHCLPLCAISPSSVIIHRSVFESAGTFNENYPACEDYELWLRIASRYPVGLIETPYLTKYGGHEDQLSQKYEAMDRFRIKALSGIISSGVLNPDQKEAAQRMLSEKLSILELGAQKRGESKYLDEIKIFLSFPDSGFRAEPGLRPEAGDAR